MIKKTTPDHKRKITLAQRAQQPTNQPVFTLCKCRVGATLWQFSMYTILQFKLGILCYIHSRKGKFPPLILNLDLCQWTVNQHAIYLGKDHLV